MTIRHKLADWISGGELTRLWARVDFLRQRNNQVWDRWSEKYTKLDAARAELRAKDKALRQIIAQETPTANATVRRMARIAREALE